MQCFICKYVIVILITEALESSEQDISLPVLSYCHARGSDITKDWALRE